MINILIADDHNMFRQGLQRLLAEAPDITVTGEASNGLEALSKAREQDFHVVLLDINMPNRSGLEVLKQLKADKPNLPVLMLSMYPEEQYAVQAFKAGASGYLTKDTDPEELIFAVRKLARGGKYATQSLAEKIMMQFDGAGDTPAHHQLSAREHQIFDLIVAGRTLTEIADALHLSISTISTYRGRILEKMKMDTNADLISYAIKHQLRD